MYALRRRWALAGSVQAVILLYIALGSIVIIAAATTPNFFTTTNIVNVLRQAIVVGLVAIGQAFVVIAGAFDFSIGVNALLSGLMGALVFGATGGNLVVGVAAALATGAGIGLVNGVLVTRIYGNPFITTFGVYFILQAITLFVTTYPVTSVPLSFQQLYTVGIGWLPWCVIAMGGVWVFAWLIASRTSFGRSLYAVGGSRRIARLSGINVSRTLVYAYVFCGFCGALAGLFTLSQSGVADVQLNGLEFSSIVAIAVGGVSLLGGSGSMVGAFGGVLLLGVVSNLLNLKQVSEFYQQFVTGLIILLAVATFKQGEER